MHKAFRVVRFATGKFVPGGQTGGQARGAGEGAWPAIRAHHRAGVRAGALLTTAYDALFGFDLFLYLMHDDLDMIEQAVEVSAIEKRITKRSCLES